MKWFTVSTPAEVANQAVFRHDFIKKGPRFTSEALKTLEGLSTGSSASDDRSPKTFSHKSGRRQVFSSCMTYLVGRRRMRFEAADVVIERGVGSGALEGGYTALRVCGMPQHTLAATLQDLSTLNEPHIPEVNSVSGGFVTELSRDLGAGFLHIYGVDS